MYNKVYYILLCLEFYSLLIHCSRDFKYDAASNKKFQEWIKTEEEFQKLDEQLKGVLKDQWENFRQYMNRKIQEHLHNSNDNCLMSNPVEECLGKGSLTESEYLLHQALDKFAQKIGNKDNVRRYHKLVHTVFEKTRKLLTDLSLIQESEHHPDILAKQSHMHFSFN